jgi:sulfatase maturation enzyme AslB (radical SAM superfamily)
MQTADKDIYCAAPFSHMVMRANGRTLPCCLFDPKTDEPDSRLVTSLRSLSDDPDPFNHQWMDDLRAAMLRNQEVKGCAECHTRELSGVSTMRQSFNHTYGRVTNPRLRYVEFDLGNLCNFKCRMCDSWSSTKWISDEIAMGKQPTAPIRSDSNKIMRYADQIDKLRFVGGEPTLEQDLIAEILEKIAAMRQSLGHLEVIVTTNTQLRLDDRVINLLQQCKKVLIQCSIDGLGKVNDYQRTGAEWANILDNLLWYQQNLNQSFETYLLTSWSSINAGQAIEFMAFTLANLPRYKNWGHVIRNPSWLDICNIPEPLKQQYKHKLASWDQHDSIDWIAHTKSLLMYQLAQPTTLEAGTVLKLFRQLDHLRSEDMAGICPDLHAALLTACENIN